MKKMTLLFTLTLLCAGALNGMEPEKPQLDPDLWGQLPEDVKPLIMVALAKSGGSLNAAIDNIKKVSLINTKLNQMINEQYGNLAGFTRLIHILANKFNMFSTSTEAIAKKFNTPAAEQYLALGEEFREKVLDQSVLLFDPEIALFNAQLLLENGLDPNFSFPDGPLSRSLLMEIEWLGQFDGSNKTIKAIIKLLRDKGAK